MNKWAELDKLYLKRLAYTLGLWAEGSIIYLYFIL